MGGLVGRGCTHTSSILSRENDFLTEMKRSTILHNCNVIFYLKILDRSKLPLAIRTILVYTVVACGRKWDEVERRNTSGVHLLNEG